MLVNEHPLRDEDDNLIELVLHLGGCVFIERNNDKDRAAYFNNDPAEFLQEYGFTPIPAGDSRKIYHRGREDENNYVTAVFEDEIVTDGRYLELKGNKQAVNDAKWDLGIELF